MIDSLESQASPLPCPLPLWLLRGINKSPSGSTHCFVYPSKCGGEPLHSRRSAAVAAACLQGNPQNTDVHAGFTGICCVGTCLAYGVSIMGTRLRLFEPGLVYNSVSRTVDRAFLFKPNHRKDNVLLAESCPARALDPNNRIVPTPSITNIIGSSIGRALDKNPIELNWFEGNVSHNHHGATCTQDSIDNIAGFFRHANSLIARQVNKTWDREGPVFSGPYRIEPCLDDISAEQKLIYSVTNPVKDGLCETVSQSPFFSTYRHLAFGEPLRFWWIDWAAYYKAGGSVNKKHHPKDYLKWTEWSLAPLPQWKDLTIHQRQTRFRQLVRQEERKQKELRNDENRARRKLGQPERKVYSLPALFALDPRGRPKNPKASGSQPLCHSQDRELRRAYIERWREFVKEYTKASADFRNGMWDREFPQGSYRPPIATIYYSSST